MTLRPAPIRSSWDARRPPPRFISAIRADLASTVRTLDATDVAIVQHVGVSGGATSAEVVDLLAKALDSAIVVLTHTVLTSPSARQRSKYSRRSAADHDHRS